MDAALARDLDDGSSRIARIRGTVRVALLVPDRTGVGVPLHRGGVRGGQVPEHAGDGVGGDPRLPPRAPPRVAAGRRDRRARLDVHVGALLRPAPLARGAGVSDVRLAGLCVRACARGRKQTVDRRGDRRLARCGRGTPRARRRRCGSGARRGMAVVVRAAREAVAPELEHGRQGRRGSARDRRARGAERARERALNGMVDRDAVVQGTHVAPRPRGRLGSDDRPRGAAGHRRPRVALVAGAARRSTIGARSRRSSARRSSRSGCTRRSRRRTSR